MKCIPGATTRTYCLKCNSNGRVIGYSKPMVYIECPVCGERWRTLSSLCECCKLPCGSPYYLECENCRGKKRGKDGCSQVDYCRGKEAWVNSIFRKREQGDSVNLIMIKSII